MDAMRDPIVVRGLRKQFPKILAVASVIPSAGTDQSELQINVVLNWPSAPKSA